MLESLLYIALGALLATLLALLVAPAIWRRAVALTQARMEAAVPLSMTELRAEKDRMRATHAVETRKLEMRETRAKERLTLQTIDVNRQRDQLLDMKTQGDRNLARIAQLETEGAELRTNLAATERKLAQANASLMGAQAEMAERTLALEEAEARYATAIDDFDGQKIEIVARETRLDAAREEVRELRLESKATQTELDRLRGTMKVAQEETTRLRDQLATQAGTISALQSAAADNEVRLERRDADLARMRSGNDAAAEIGAARAEVEALQEALAVARASAALDTGKGHNDAAALENAALRDAISELAARIIADQSAHDPDAPALRAVLDGDPDGGSEKTLADRIRDHAARNPQPAFDG